MLDLFEVLVLELLVLLKDSSLLNISEHKTRDFLEVEMPVARKREYLIGVLIVDYDEYLRIASLDQLLSFPEKPTFLDIKCLILCIFLLLEGFESL